MSGTDLDLVVLPDVVQLVTTWLRAQPEVAALVDDRVYSVVPADRTYPLVLVQQVADRPLIQRPWYAVETDLQVSAYADTSNAARYLAELVRGVSAARLIGSHTDPPATVSWVEFVNLAFLPDTDIVAHTGRPMPRWLTTMSVTAHP